MSQDHLSSNDARTVQEGLAMLYKYGWDHADCYKETAKLFGDLPEDYQGVYRDVEHALKENYHIDRCVEIMVDHSTPTRKPGFFELNERMVNPMDGYSVVALEGIARVYLDLAGRLDRMDYNLNDLLNMDAAQSFFHDWVNAQPEQAVVIKGIGGDFPLYFKPSDQRGKLPILDIEAMKESISLGFKEMSESRVNDTATVLAHHLSSPKRQLERVLALRQDWGRLTEKAYTASPTSSFS